MANVAYLTVVTPTAMIASNAIAVVSNIFIHMYDNVSVRTALSNILQNSVFIH